MKVLQEEDQYVLNYCAKYLARNNTERAIMMANSMRTTSAGASASRGFPIVDTYSDGVDYVGSYPFNQVTFVYCVTAASVPPQVAVLGLSLISTSPFRCADHRHAVLHGDDSHPEGQVHLYKYVVDGQAVVDPINPQRVTQDNGQNGHASSRIW